MVLKVGSTISISAWEQTQVQNIIKKSPESRFQEYRIIKGENAALTKLHSTLTQALQNSVGTVNFTDNQEMRETIDKIVGFSPLIFGVCDFKKGEQYTWNSKFQIENSLIVINTQYELNLKIQLILEMYREDS